MLDFLRRTWAQVDLSALRHNLHEIRGLLQPGCRLMAVVKADAYGHGDRFCAQEMAQAGADWFGVSNIEEGMSLRNEGITKPILILGYTPVDTVKILAEKEITQALVGMDYCKALQAEAEKAGVTVEGHIKLDTGMTRVG